MTMAPHTIDDIKGRVLAFMRTEIFDASMVLDADTNLFESGFDSFSLMKLLVFVEKTYNIRVPDEEIVEDNIRTVTLFSNLIHALKTKH